MGQPSSSGVASARSAGGRRRRRQRRGNVGVDVESQGMCVA